MSILATVKRFDEASAAYGCMKTIQNSFDFVTPVKKLTAYYLKLLYFKPVN